MASPSSFDQLDHSKLFKAPVSNKEESMMQEELTLLCMLDHHERIKDLPPQSWYWVKHRDWIAKQIEFARKGNYDIARNVPHLLCLTQNERQTEIMRLRAELVKLPKGPMATGVARVRDNCEALFTGKADPLSLLLRGNTLTRIYDVGSFDHSDFMQAFSQAKPNLKVLEVGAGTGGTTAKFLKELRSYERYTFSDLSAGFFPRARQRFSYANGMDFKVFDVSKSPASQGLDLAFYDLVIAPQVLHATPSLRETLSNVQSLLLPGGYLVLTETSTEGRTTHYFFGIFEGWWLGEADGRTDGPCVSPERWDKELRAAGFSGVDQCVMDADAPFNFCALMVSRAV
ncbi:hypothetical protein FDECE_2837 [Fusarium decemcellulare]|nr:hypothetical protein FDECE_2837 [Fusarium decemcellulare]